MMKLSILLLVLAAVPIAPIAALRFAAPPTSAFMLQSEVQPVAYRWVPLERIAPELAAAVIAAEDQKFHDHVGFDLEAMREAFTANAQRRRPRGASTISQQTAKNLFLWPGGGYLRKAIEAYLTLWIEALWPKSRILEIYLNIAEFAPGVYGAEAAARRHFGKSAAALSAEEAARLAAVLPNPRRWRAAAPGPYVRARSAWILGQMGYGTAATPEEEPDESMEPEARETPLVPAPDDASPSSSAADPAPPDTTLDDAAEGLAADPTLQADVAPSLDAAAPSRSDAAAEDASSPPVGTPPASESAGDAAAGDPAAAERSPQPGSLPVLPPEDSGPAVPDAEAAAEGRGLASASKASTAAASTGLTR